MGNGGASTRNKLLLGLSQKDFDLLAPNFESVLLSARTHLVRAGRPIEYAYFLEDGLASVIAGGSGNRPMEVGLFGREGMSGLVVVQGSDRSPHECVVEVAGRAQQIATADLRDAAKRSDTLLRALLIFGYLQMVQIAETARANGRFSVRQRLARWLLMAQDRLEDESIPLTQNYLATMVGARRVSVTLALQALTKLDIVRLVRGRVIILERLRLLEAAGDCYGVAEAECRRLAPAMLDFHASQRRIVHSPL